MEVMVLNLRKILAIALCITCFTSGNRLCAEAQNIVEQRARRLSKMKLGLTLQQTQDVCRFIEKEQEKPHTERHIYSQEVTHLPCTVEYSQVLHGFLLKDLSKKSRIGRGVHKVVYRAILYGPCPKEIAECDSDDSAKSEIRVLEEIRGCRGIVPYLGAISYGDNRYTVYLRYFSGGSLKRLIKQGVALSDAQIFKIAKDAVRGLLNMHRHKIVHRDLHAGNILLRVTKQGQYEAALVDFGRSEKYNKIGDGLPQAASSRNPPEGLIVPFRRLNRFLVDVYAMGCNFYSLVWKTHHPWASAYNAHDMSIYSQSVRKKKYCHIVHSYKKTLHKHLGEIIIKIKSGKKISSMDKFKLLTFKMLNYNPDRRPSLRQVAKTLEKLSSE